MSMFKMAWTAVCIGLLVFFSSCGGNSGTSTVGSDTTTQGSTTTTTAGSPVAAYTNVLDLNASGFPFKVKAPADARIVSKKGLIQEGIIEGTNYHVQVIGQDALTTDRKALKAEALAEVKASPEFSSIVLEEDFGFIYETKWDNNSKAYNFRYALVVGNKTYDFRSSVVTSYTKEQIEAMYRSVKQE